MGSHITQHSGCSGSQAFPVVLGLGPSVRSPGVGGFRQWRSTTLQLQHSQMSLVHQQRTPIPKVMVCVSVCVHNFMTCLCRILSIACSTSSSTFALSAAASTGTPPNSTSYLSRSYGLTSPGLPSSKFVSNEMSLLRSIGSTVQQQPHEVYPGGVYIYDLKSQKQKVHMHMHMHMHMAGVRCCDISLHSVPSPSLPILWPSTAWPSTTTAVFSSLELVMA